MADEEFDIFEDYVEKIEEGEKKEEGKKEREERERREDKKKKKEVHERITAGEVVKEIIQLAKREKKISFFLGVEIALTILLILMLLGVLPFF